MLQRSLGRFQLLLWIIAGVMWVPMSSATASPSKAEASESTRGAPPHAETRVDPNAPAPSQATPRDIPPFEVPVLGDNWHRTTRQTLVQQALDRNPEIAQARSAVARAESERLRAQARNDALFRTGLDAMHNETPVDSGITKGINRQDLIQLNTSITRRFDTGTTLTAQMQNGYVYSVFPLMIAGVLSRNIESGPNYLNQLTLSLNQNLLKGRSKKTAQTGDLLATLQSRMAKARLRSIQQKVVYDTVTAYAQLYAAEAQFVVQERSYARTLTQIEAGRAQREAGWIAPYEYNLLLLRLAQNQDAWIVAEQAVRSASRALTLVTGAPLDRRLLLTQEGEALHYQASDAPLSMFWGAAEEDDVLIEVVHEVLPQTRDDVQHNDPSQGNASSLAPVDREGYGDAWCERAMQHNAELEAVAAQIDAAYASMVPVEDQQRDQLDIHVGVTSTGLDDTVARSLQKMATFDALTVFGGVSYQRQLRNRGAKAQHQIAQNELEQARLQEEALRQTLCAGVLDAADRVVMQRRREALARWRTSVAYEGFQAESARFARGHSTMLQVLDALTHVDVTELDALRTQLDRQNAWWELQRQAGTILRSLVVE